MKVYLVGGAVRDQVLAYPVVEKDWVVVGGSAEELLALGYHCVGQDFPVYLHPVTHEEYALARKERKTGPGYQGFSLDYSTDVSLEEDLARRDLTINAMALDDAGHLIDPHQGLSDLQAKVLRHISLAFLEDPVRVLRVARFMARYHHLGFTIAKETMALMIQMVDSGELNHLVAERIWQEWHKSLAERNPEQFIITLRSCGALKLILPELDALFGIPNPASEGFLIDAGMRSLQVLQNIAASSSEVKLRFAALCQGLYKLFTPIHLWPHHLLEDKATEDLLTKLCARLRLPTDFRELALLVLRLRSKILALYQLTAEEIVMVLESGDAYRRWPRFNAMLAVCEADFSLFLAANRIQEDWVVLYQETLAVQIQDYLNQGLSGQSLKLKLRHLRIDRVAAKISLWKKHES